MNTYFIVGNLAALTPGIALGWTSPVSPKLTNQTKVDENPFGRAISDQENSWIGSALGAIIGPFLAGYSADKFGRKKTLLVCSGIPFLLSFLMLVFAKTIILYYIPRFLAGAALGGVFTVLPNFNSEIAEDSIRGAISSSMNIFVVTGPLLSYAVGPYISIMLFSIICAIIPAVFLILFFLVVPESPYYLIAANDVNGATTALRKFRSETENGISKEMESIRQNVEEAMKTKGNFLDIFKSKGLKRALMISLT